jgi:hypothetical protein
MYTFRVAGWLEVLDEGLDRVAACLRAAHPTESGGQGSYEHAGPWFWRRCFYPVVAYVTYACQIGGKDLPAFEDLVRAIADIGPDVTGYFHAQGEDGAINYEFKIVEGRLSITSDDRPLIDYGQS